VRTIAAALAALAALISGAAPTAPVYVGARACGACHTGAGMGHQYAKWLGSKHAKAYAVLSNPESVEIARLSGVRMEPWKSPICLGCHATAAFAEDWEKDDGFRVEDGVQCETCHGPGSEYMAEEVMRDRAAAMKAGLRRPTETTCRVCHLAKRSHEQVLKNPTIDIAKGLKEIAHPAPARSRVGSLTAAAGGCAGCHERSRDAWRQSAHARAWATLASEKSAKIAAERGVNGDAPSSAACVKCHGPGADASGGVGCEACHGAGREHAAGRARMQPVAKDACFQCHSKTFDAAAGLLKIAHASKRPAVKEAPRYLTPISSTLRPGTAELWVACEAGGVVAIVDPVRRVKVAEVRTGEAPTAVAFSPDGARAYVSNRMDDTVSVVDAAARAVLATLETGDEPHGLIVDSEGRRLYVLNTASDDITVFDTVSLKREKRLAGGHGPWSLALSPDGRRILATNTYANLDGLRRPMRSEVTVIDARSGIVEDRWIVDGTNLMTGVAWHPSGEYAIAAMNRTKGLVPMTRLMQGWTITNGLAVMRADGRADQVLLDQPGMGFADANGVAMTPDGRYALVSSSGTDRVAVIDFAKLRALVERASEEERRRVLPNHLGKSAEFVAAYVATGYSPRGITVSRDGTEAWVANAIGDSLTVIDLRAMQPSGTIALGGPGFETLERYGERLFHSADHTFRRQFSCHSCHPDGHVDRVTYDIEADGIGVSPVDNRTLRGIVDTAPFKWEGTNPTLARQCGARLSVFFTRAQPFDAEQLKAVERYVTTIPRPPNRYWRPGDKLTAAQRRGKAIFERRTTADGREIPDEGRCVFCHPPPYYTNRGVFDVGTRQALDRTGLFDVPHLNNIYDSAPYLHNGMARTLEEIWTVYNPKDTHGVTNDLTKDQLNDLIEYLKTL
jgi:YVTN family beta-propeller protein